MDLAIDRLVKKELRSWDGIWPYWHLLAAIDFRGHVLDRPKQRAFLARYARQDMSEDLPVPELDLRVSLIAERLKIDAPRET